MVYQVQYYVDVRVGVFGVRSGEETCVHVWDDDPAGADQNFLVLQPWPHART